MGTHLWVFKPDLFDHGDVAAVTLHAVGAQGHAGVCGAAGVQEVVPPEGALAGSLSRSHGGGRMLLQRVKADDFPPPCSGGQA